MKTFPCLFALLAACHDVSGSTSVQPDAGEHVLHCGADICNASPQPTCIDGDTLRAYDGATCDADRRCAYPSHELPCGVLGCCGDRCCSLYPVVTKGDEQ